MEQYHVYKYFSRILKRFEPVHRPYVYAYAYEYIYIPWRKMSEWSPVPM